jgi:uncharacterized protein (DUF952 family)
MRDTYLESASVLPEERRDSSKVFRAPGGSLKHARVFPPFSNPNIYVNNSQNQVQYIFKFINPLGLHNTCSPCSPKLMSAPIFVFKIVVSPPDLTSKKVEPTEHDKESGFIRLSSGRQAPETCDLFFSSVQKLYIIRIAYEKLKANIKWEPSRDQFLRCAHFYGELWTIDVDSMRTYERGDESWEERLRAEEWILEGTQELAG